MTHEDRRSAGRAPEARTRVRTPNFRRVVTPARRWKLQWGASRKNGCPGFWRADPTCLVWAKPRRPRPDIPVKEKIAADLGRLLGLPVAPVLLTRTRLGGGVRVLALSRWEPAEAHRKWSRVLSCGPPWLARLTRRWFRRNRSILPGIWVLDTWLGNHDRTNRNVMVAYDETDGRTLRAVYFFDFDASQGWLRRGREAPWHRWRVTRPARTIAAVRRCAGPRELKRWIRRVERLPVRHLRRIVWRLPPRCLSRSEKRRVLRILLFRRRQLRRAFREVLRT